MELTNDFRVNAPEPKVWDVLTDVERIAPMLPGAQLQEIEGDDFRGVVKVKVGPITAQYKGTASFQERDQADGRVVLKASGRDTRGQGNASAIITATLVPDGDGTKVTVVTDLTVTGKVAQFGRGVLADVSAKLIGQFVDALEAELRQDAAPGAPEADVTAIVPDGAVPETALPDTTGPDGAVADAAVADTTVQDTTGPDGAVPEMAGPDTTAADGDAPGGTTPTAGAPASHSEPAEDAPKIRRIDSPEPEPVDLLDAAGGSVVKRLLPVLGGLGVLILVLLIGRSRRKG